MAANVTHGHRAGMSRLCGLLDFRTQAVSKPAEASGLADMSWP